MHLYSSIGQLVRERPFFVRSIAKLSHDFFVQTIRRSAVYRSPRLFSISLLFRALIFSIVIPLFNSQYSFAWV